MFPAFRSVTSAANFCALLIGLLCLPVVAYWIGHPPREQAYAAITDEAGPVGAHVREIFQDPSDTDVLFLGSSLVRAGIDLPTVKQVLSAHLGRPAHVQMLALNWQGLDLQYFMLRDYLKTHRASLVVWNLPVPGSRNVEPHVEAFRWVRYGEYSDALSGLPLRYRLALYGDMILGAPRELLSHIRPNLLSTEEATTQIRSAQAGYYGAPFVLEPVNTIPAFPAQEIYEHAPYDLVHVTGKPLNPYEQHFASAVVKLLRERNTRLALLHIPIDSEEGLNYMPERGNWPDTLHTDAPLVGIDSASLFRSVDQGAFHNYYRDQHFNLNGSLLFTRSIIPGILSAYDEGRKSE